MFTYDAGWSTYVFGTPDRLGLLENPQKWRDLEEYINLDTKKFIQIQKLTKLHRFDFEGFFGPKNPL